MTKEQEILCVPIVNALQARGLMEHVSMLLLFFLWWRPLWKMEIRKGCTDNLQSLHVPKKIYDGVYYIFYILLNSSFSHEIMAHWYVYAPYVYNKVLYFIVKLLAADKIPWKRKHTDEKLEDPRKDKYMKYSSGYSSYIYNCMVNFCSQSSTNISWRYLTPSTSLQV